MTLMQKKFIAEYIKTGSAMEAAKAAGYRHPRVKGSWLSKQPEIAAEIQRRMNRYTNRRIAQADEIREKMTEILLTSEKAADSCKAADVLNKMSGDYAAQKMEVLAQLKLTPEQAEDKAVEVYKSNPDLWDRIKRRVESKEE